MSPGEEPWSPFPVQDWATLHPDPLGGHVVNPTWAPPSRQVPWWLPLAVLLTVGALVAAASYAASTWAIGPRPTRAMAFVPADGTAAYERLVTTGQQGTTTVDQVSESAVLTGFYGLLSVDAAFGAKFSPDVVDDAADLKLWRVTSTPLGAEQPHVQTTTVYRVNGAVELLGRTAPGGAYLYQPALVELPADVRVGSAWSSSGSAGGSLTYLSQLHASAAAGPAPGCLDIAGTISYRSATVVQPSTKVQRTWCPRRGITSSVDSAGGDLQTLGQTPPPTPRAVPTAALPLPHWADPQRWQKSYFGATSTDPNFGRGPLLGTPKSIRPVRTDSGVLVRPTVGANDLIGLTSTAGQTWDAGWRTHLGGTILSLSAFGDVVMVTSSDRQLVAYSDRGVRLWQHGWADLAPLAPVRAGDTQVVLVDLSGAARLLDIVTGAIIWQHGLGSDVDVAPVVGAGQVVVMDRGGTTTALDLRTGRPRWTLDLLGLAAAFVPGADTLVVLQDQTAHGIDPGSGQQRWLRPFVGTVVDLVPFAGRVVLVTKSATVALDASGAVVARLPAYVAVTVSADHLLGWGAAEAQVLDSGWRPVASWPLPALTLTNQDRFAAALPDGVLLVNDDWTFQVWATPAGPP